MNCNRRCKTEFDIADGYSLVELLIVLAIIMTVAAIAVPNYFEMVNTAKIVVAKTDIKQISTAIDASFLTSGVFPNSLAEVGFGNRCDPWGRPYQYLNIQNASSKGKGGGGGGGGGGESSKVRKDKNLHPLNSDYDLYSMGRDGQSLAPLTAEPSRDDIIRANNGGFIGLATDY
jgi:general secretion pathway protein G